MTSIGRRAWPRAWPIVVAVVAGCGGDGVAGDPDCRLSGSLSFEWSGPGAPDMDVHSLLQPDRYLVTPKAGGPSCEAKLAACNSGAGITPKDVADAIAADDVEAAWPGTTGGVRAFQRSPGPAEPDFSVSKLGRGTLVFTATCAGKDDCRTQTVGLADLESLLQQLAQDYGPSCQ